MLRNVKDQLRVVDLERSLANLRCLSVAGSEVPGQRLARGAGTKKNIGRKGRGQA